MAESNHTPTPWRFVPWHIEEGPSAVRAPEGWLICETSSDADAEIIALAVNSHASLIEERDRLLKVLVDAEDFFNGGENHNCPTHQRIIAAIGDAKGGAS